MGNRIIKSPQEAEEDSHLGKRMEPSDATPEREMQGKGFVYNYFSFAQTSDLNVNEEINFFMPVV